MIVISLTRVRRGFGVVARLCVLLFLAGFVLPRAVDAMARLMIPAAGKGAANLGLVIEKVLSIIGIAR
ncbi:MAG: hypothetical protein HPY55_09665 [Firmicutes bacterium]|nr:hypothetical protein [Bacillota bacterium]